MCRCRKGLFLIVYIFYLSDFSFTKDINMFKWIFISQQDKPMSMTPMEALDKVQEIYATNFDKVFLEEGSEEYYYKLSQSEYYLVYEGIEAGKCYLFHLYEFVLDEPDTGIGHTVTYGWYSVLIESGEVISVVEL